MSLKDFLLQPYDSCRTIVTIGQPGTGKTFNMLNCLKKYWLPKKTFDEIHLILPNFNTEVNGSYDFLRKIQSKNKFIFVYDSYNPIIVERILAKQTKKDKKRIFFGLDDTTSQSKELFNCHQMSKLATQSRHYNIHTWIIMHYGKGVIDRKVRENIGFIFINRIKFSLLEDIYKEYCDFPRDFPKTHDFENFMLELFESQKYPCLLIDFIHRRWNSHVSSWFEE